MAERKIWKILKQNDLGLLLEELLDVRTKWYNLGLQLKLSVSTQDRIKTEFSDPREQLFEMLKTWLSCGYNPSWKTLTDALRSRNVGACQLADHLEAKCMHETAQSPPDITDPSQVDSTPLGKILTLDDLHLLLEELLDVRTQWYHLGLLLKLDVGTLEMIRRDFHDPRDRLLEMLKDWLTTPVNRSRKALTDALRSRLVGASQLADHLEAKYCRPKDMEDTLEAPQSPPGITDPSQVDSTPLGKILLTLDELHLLLEELLDVRTNWYYLGLQLKLSVGTLDRIKRPDPRDRLLEMLKIWLTTAVNPNWKTLTDALRCRSVGASLLADILEAKYCLVEDTLEAAETPGITDLSQVDSTSPGNKLTLDDLGLLLEELLDVRTQWYSLGLQLKLSVGTLDMIGREFHNPRDRLLEMLKTWLRTAVNPSWKILTNALRSRNVGASLLADIYEAKYCLTELTTSTSDSQPETNVPPPSTLPEQVLPTPQPLTVNTHRAAETPGITDVSQVDSTSPGNKLTLDDLGLLLDELLDVRIQWYPLGLQLKVKVKILDRIREQFPDPRDQLQEMLKTWLTTSDNTSWKTLTDALRSRSVGASQLANDLEAKGRPKHLHKSAQSPPGTTDPSQVDSTPLGENPALPLSLKQILKDTKEVTRWFFLGVQLDIQSDFLKQIEINYAGDPERCKIEVIDIWLRHYPEPTWNKLAQAVEDMGGHAKVVETLRANHEGVPQISKVPLTTHDEDKSAPASVSDYPSPPPTLQPAVAQGETSSSLTHLEAAPQLVQGQFGYKTVQLLKRKSLGSGSCGAVYKAMCDDLPCAGKILHPTLFQFNDPGAMTITVRFQQECNFLGVLRHPNIVQYLGSYQDQGTQLPVLLMELMDESLTQFLERSQEPLPHHTQVDICHDIALALAYLHSNDIIHRDLSSNNVLLIGAGSRAKVTDFGMAKLFDANRTTMTPQTMCPGTLPYMSPEALDDPPVYTKKLDTFSFGVLGIQIIIRQFPDPGPRTKKVRDPHDPKRRLQEVVPETDRRKSHIDLINPTHPLLPIATECLSYNEEDRPSAQELCHHLAALKEAPQYGDSMQEAQERSRTVHRGRQIKELQQEEEFHEQVQVLQQQLQSQVQEKDTELAVRQQEYEAVSREKDHIIEAKEMQLQKINQQLAASEQVTAQLQKEMQHLQQELQEKEQEVQQLQQATQTKDVRDRQLQELNQRLAASEQVTARLQRTIQELQEENKRKLGKFPMVTQKGSVHGVEVAGEVEFTVLTERGTFQWKGYGLRLHVSKDSLPPGTTECTINIRVSLAGQFQLPEGSDLFSPVFWISAPCKFTKPVTLEIQHCALTEDEAVLSNLSFVFTKCSQKDLPYRFRQVDGGVFTKHSTYGSIELKQFSGISISGSEETPRSYCAHLYHTMENVHDWIFYFVITQDLDTENTVVREHYRHFASQKATVRVSFESSEITLNIPVPDGLDTGKGWRITPFTAPTITKKDVDQFEKGRWIPECQLAVQWEREDQKPVRLRQKVDLTGAKAPYNFINLILNPAGQGTEPLLSPRTQSSGGKPTMPELLKFTCADNKTINVTKEIGDEYRCFGIFLLQDLNGQKVKSIKSKHQSDPSQINTEILEEWLAGKGKKPVTWATLVEVLCDTELYSLADVISAVKCPNSEQ